LFGLGVVGAFAAAMTMWGTLAPISGAAIASANLQVEGRRQSVQHPYGGVVRQLLARDGAHVEKGQLLIALDDSEPRAKLEVLVADRDAALAAEARLIAERDGAGRSRSHPSSRGAAEPGVREILDAQRRIFAARRVALEGQRQILTERIAQLRSQIEGLRAQERATIDQRRLIADELADVGSLVKQGLELMPRLRSIQRSAADLDGRLGQFRSEIAKAQQAVGETRLEIIDLDNRRAEEVVSGCAMCSAAPPTCARKCAPPRTCCAGRRFWPRWTAASSTSAP
jgi:multidrug efflux pump subunit AcrA (membrane-fusion protein)